MTTDAKHLCHTALCAAACWIVVLPTSSQFGKCADPIGRLARRVSDPGMQVLLSKIPGLERRALDELYEFRRRQDPWGELAVIVERVPATGYHVTGVVLAGWSSIWAGGSPQTSNIGNDAIVRLQSFPYLRTVELLGTMVDRKGLQQLSRIPSIEYVGLPHHLGDDDLGVLNAFPKLRGLSVRQLSGITDRGVKDIRRLEHLRFLDTAATSLTGKGWLQRCRSLTDLRPGLDLDISILLGPSLDVEARLLELPGDPIGRLAMPLAYKRLQRMLELVPKEERATLSRIAAIVRESHHTAEVAAIVQRIAQDRVFHITGIVFRKRPPSNTRLDDVLNPKNIVASGGGQPEARITVGDSIVAELRKLKQLRTLDLRGTVMSDEGIRELGSGRPSIRYIGLPQRADAAAIVPLLDRFAELTALSVAGVSDLSDETMRKFRRADVLEFLDTSDTPLRGTKWLGTCRRLRFVRCDKVVQDLP